MSESTGENLGNGQFESLEQRYRALYDWAKDQTFVVVYRTEGDSSWNVDRSGGAAQLQGTWYTDRFEKIAGVQKNIEEMSGMPAKTYSLVIPKALLDDRDAMTKGMDEVNVVNADLRAGRKEIAEPEVRTSVPTLDEYMNQFAFVREYLDLKKKRTSSV